MEVVQIDIPDGKQALFLRLADGFRKEIQSGQFKPGELLPSSRQWADALDIHRHTIRASLDQLVAEGWLDVVPRKGYVVRETIKGSDEQPKFKEFKWPVVRKVTFASFAPEDGTKIKHNFQSGIPDLRIFPTDEFKTVVSDALRNANAELLDYSHPLGHKPLRDQISQYIAELRDIEGREIIVTNGSQEAIFIAVQLLVSPGDHVALEELSYPPARETFKAAGAKIVTIKMDEQGAIPESFAKAAEKHKLKMLFLTPTHQFPTTSNMSVSRKQEIYEIAHKHGVAILEDDYDHEFHFRSHPPNPIAADDPAGLVLYVSTFSKVLFPSARLAFMAVPETFAPHFKQFRRLVSHQNDAILQDALGKWIGNKGFTRHLNRMRKTYLSRRDNMIEQLTKHRDKGAKLDWVEPEGGMALWLDINQDADRFAKKLAKSGMFVTPESYYRTRKGESTHLRLGYSNQTEAEMRAALNDLVKGL